MEPSIEFLTLQDPEIGELKVTKDVYGKSCAVIHHMIDLLLDVEDFRVTFDSEITGEDRYVPGEYEKIKRELVPSEIWGRRKRNFEGIYGVWKVSGLIDQAFDRRVKEGLLYILVPHDKTIPAEKVYHKNEEPKYFPYLDINLESEDDSIHGIRIRPDRRGLAMYPAKIIGDQFVGYLFDTALDHTIASSPELAEVEMPIVPLPEPISIHNL